MEQAIITIPGQCRMADEIRTYERLQATAEHAQAVLDAKVEQALNDLLGNSDNFASYVHHYEPELGKLLEALRLVPRASQGSREAKETIFQKLMEFHNELEGEMKELVLMKN